MRVSAHGAGIDWSTAYRSRRRSPRFAAQWDAAIEEAADELEAEARRRAMATSDTLLIFLLKGARPERYRDRQLVEHRIDDASVIARVRRLARAEGLSSNDEERAVHEAERMLAESRKA